MASCRSASNRSSNVSGGDGGDVDPNGRSSRALVHLDVNDTKIEAQCEQRESVSETFGGDRARARGLIEDAQELVAIHGSTR